MTSFSEKYGYVKEKQIQFESVDSALRNRIWNLFYNNEITKGGLSSHRIEQSFSGNPAIEDLILDKLGFSIGESKIQFENTKLNQLKSYIVSAQKWYSVYDFVDAHLSCLKKGDMQERAKRYNQLFEEEKSGYRIVNGEVAPITNDQELQAIEQAANSKYNSVNICIGKALSLYADRKAPDYENSIKESISAVEAICCIITNDNKATLGQALKKLETSGIMLHKSFRNALDSLYGYTSNENGIRHAGIDFNGASSEDAKYMLVSCSAFVNYLIEKWEKSVQ